jgi:hypothetical protein
VSRYRRRRPPLYRLARYLRWCSLLALFLVVVFLASTIDSAVVLGTHLQVTTPGGRAYSFSYTPSRGFVASFEVNITNAGYYPLVLDLSAVANTSQGPLIPYFTTGEVTVAPDGRTTPFGFTVTIPQSTLAADGAYMLLHNTPVSGAVWFNGSFAWIYQFGFSVAANGTWGAPFENLTVQPGTPASAGGQTTVPVGINYTNDAFFSGVGNLSFQVVDNGTSCGPPTTLPLDTPSQQAFAGTVNLTGPSGCMVPGATVEPSYTVGPLTFALPSVRLS